MTEKVMVGFVTINYMQNLKKPYFFSTIIFFSFFFFFTTTTFAVPGQLNYDINTPQIDNSICNEALSTSKTCQLEKAQLEKTNMTLTNELAQAKKNIFILELVLIVVVLSFAVAAGVIVFLKTRRQET